MPKVEWVFSSIFADDVARVLLADGWHDAEGFAVDEQEGILSASWKERRDTGVVIIGAPISSVLALATRESEE